MAWSIFGGDPIGRSPDLDRVVALERRERPVEGTPEADELAATVTGWFARPDTDRPSCGCSVFGKPCIKCLRVAQAHALLEIRTVRGLFGILPVGYGKTILGVLGPLALEDCREALLLAKPSLIGQLGKNYLHIAEHFRVPALRIHAKDGLRAPGTSMPDGSQPPTLHVMSYDGLSGKKSAMLLDQIRPDFIMADEVQCLAGDSTRTRRLWRYLVEQEERGAIVRFAGWSGTVTGDSIMNYWRWLLAALREGSPLPLDKNEAELWAGAIDPSPWPSPPGELGEALCEHGEHIQSGYYRRLVETEGVVSADSPPVDCHVEITDRLPEPPPGVPTTHDQDTGANIPTELWDAMQLVRTKWTRPDGLLVFEEKIEQWRCLWQLSCGFYLRWEFPNGEPDDLIDLWLARRADWSREVRELMERNIRCMDSPYLARLAAERFLAGLEPTRDEPVWDCWALEPWLEVEDSVKPITVPVRVCDYVVRDAIKWIQEDAAPGVIWYLSSELETWIAELAAEAGIDLGIHGGGPTAGDRMDAETGQRSIAASVLSHGTGRDGMQYKWARQYIMQPFATPTGWEQLFGRLARFGQTAQHIPTDVLATTPEFVKSLDKAIMKAKYVQRTTGVRQTLLACERGLRAPREFGADDSADE